MSAKYGHGVEDIKNWILSKLPVGPAYYPKVLRTLSICVLSFSNSSISKIGKNKNEEHLCHIFIYSQDIVSEHPERFFVSEIVREKIFMQYRNEVPYACQVFIYSL